MNTTTNTYQYQWTSTAATTTSPYYYYTTIGGSSYMPRYTYVDAMRPEGDRRKPVTYGDALDRLEDDYA